MRVPYSDFTAFIFGRYDTGDCILDCDVEAYYEPYAGGYGVFGGASKDTVQHWLLRMLDEGKLRMEGFRYFAR